MIAVVLNIVHSLEQRLRRLTEGDPSTAAVMPTDQCNNCSSLHICQLATVFKIVHPLCSIVYCFTTVEVILDKLPMSPNGIATTSSELASLVRLQAPTPTM